MLMSDFAKANSALSTNARKNGQSLYMVVSSVLFAGSSTSEDMAAPIPYHAGIKHRDCVQEKTQGMARKSLRSPPGFLREGREPIGNCSMSDSGVTQRKY